MKKMKKLLITMLCLTILGTCVGVLAGCDFSSDGENTVTLSGSTSVEPLMKELIAAFEAKNKDVNVEIQSVAGSSQGIADANKGAVDIGMSSRALKAAEKETLTETVIAKDGIVMIVNKSVELNNVTSQQVYDLYANGTAIESISMGINRSAGSGTRDGFNELIKNTDGKSLKELATLKGDEMGTTGEVIGAVEKATNKLGYISLGSFKADGNIKMLNLDGVEPTVENIKAGTYALQRPFVLATKKDKALSDAAQRFLDFIASEEGQEIIQKEGYITIA